ncbi:MAG: hypothetical protein FWG71_01050 [Synergistaceae bacterium]|nr:hypothetical protein [Synergistaceae bacterium]
MPRAQLDESERHFTEGYRHFLARNYWSALDFLDRALRANTYLIDHYLMKALVMNRTGDYGAGRESLEHYLEVRPMDAMVPRVLSYAISQQRVLQRILSPSAVSVPWRFTKVDMQNELDLGYMRPFSIKGLGKAGMWGKSLYLADTIGDRVIYRRRTARRMGVLHVNHPVAVLPMGDDSFYIVSSGGEVHYFGAFSDGPNQLSTELRGVLENTSVTDAAMISETEFVVADSVAREIAFYSLTAMPGAPVDGTPPAGQTGAWSPPDDVEALFEPVASSAYGQWLAVADRGGGRIFFLNLGNRREFFSAEISRPRDVAWSTLGELLVINEDGDLFKVSVDFRDGRAEAVNKLESGLTDGWALFGSPDGDVYCMDISGSSLWKAVPIPDAAMSVSLGVISLAAPTVTRDENRESFLLDATFMSPFKTYSRTSALVAHVVWNNRTIPSVAWWDERRNDAVRPDIVLFNRPAPPGAVNPAINNVTVENGAGIRIALPSVWSLRGGSLTNLIIDSTVDMTQEDLNVVTLFCLKNGVELDVWARSVPSVELARAAGLTGGKTVFSLINQPDLSLPRPNMRVRIPLPQELSSSGYPSRSMLSMFLDVGLMHARDWIPLWPDMLD